MRKLILLLLMSCAVAVPASAQMKLSGKEACPKPDVQQSVDVTDMPGHALMIQHGNCTWPTPFELAGLKPVSSVDVNTDEAWGGKVTEHGYDVGTMDNGDTYTAKYSGTITMAQDGTSTFHGSWTFVGGTGKLKGLSGGGTYGGTGAADGSVVSDVKGTYSVSKAPMKPMAPAMKPAS
jgi:hypothetical protein